MIGQLPNPPERMVGWDSLLLTTHQQLSSCPIVAEVAGFFSELLRGRPSGRQKKARGRAGSSWMGGYGGRNVAGMHGAHPSLTADKQGSGVLKIGFEAKS